MLLNRDDELLPVRRRCRSCTHSTVEPHSLRQRAGFRRFAVDCAYSSAFGTLKANASKEALRVKMPPRRSAVGGRAAAARRKMSAVGMPSPEQERRRHVGSDETMDEARSREIKDLSASRINRVITWVLGLYHKVNGAVFAYFCFLTIFSIVARNSQVGGFDSPIALIETLHNPFVCGLWRSDSQGGKRPSAIREFPNSAAVLTEATRALILKT